MMCQFFKHMLTVVLLLFILKIGNGQNRDTTTFFTEQAFLEWVRQYHPIVQQANLLTNIGAAYQLKARGGFDPKIFGTLQQKSFDGKTYFTVGDTGLKIPSWLGAEFKVGYNWTNGVFLDPEQSLPANGQAYAGVKWSLGRGLLIDERRAVLEKAKFLQAANEAERSAIVNDLMLDAGKAYWEWVNAYHNLTIYQEALDLAVIRLEGVRSSFLQGDKPAIDTLESTIQVQNRQIAVNDATIIYENSQRYLSNFLWYQNELPLEISDLLAPPPYRNITLQTVDLNARELVNNLSQNHPVIQQYFFKLKQLEVERRLKKEQLKPQVDVEFNFLANGFDFVNRPKIASDIGTLNAIFTENYKAGIKVGMPIFLRKERANLELTDLKLLDTNYKLRQKTQELKNKLLNYQELLNNSRQQVKLNQVMVTNYQDLLLAENEKFRYGESSIFLLNSREQKLIDARLKLTKLMIVYQKNRLGLVWALGQLI